MWAPGGRGDREAGEAPGAWGPHAADRQGARVLPGNGRRRVPRNRWKAPRPAQARAPGRPPGGCFLPGEARGRGHGQGRRWDSGRVPVPRALRTPRPGRTLGPSTRAALRGAAAGPRGPSACKAEPPRSAASDLGRREPPPTAPAAFPACPALRRPRRLVGAATRRRGPNSARSAPGRWTSAGAARGAARPAAPRHSPWRRPGPAALSSLRAPGRRGQVTPARPRPL